MRRSAAAARRRSAALWLPTVLAAAAGLLVVADFVLSASNRKLQAEANERQQFLNQSAPLRALNDQIIAALANLSAQSQDTAIRDMLAEHGVTFTVRPQPAAAGK